MPTDFPGLLVRVPSSHIDMFGHCNHARYRIRVNCVLPGPIDTEMMRSNVQFHWTQREGQPLADFTDLLASLQRDKRKKIQQERRRVVEAGISELGAYLAHEGII